MQRFPENGFFRYHAHASTSRRSNRMSFSAHYLFAVLLTILSLPTSLWAQAALKETTKSVRGSISGRVTLKEKGVFGVAVMVRKSEPGNSTERFPRAM